MGENALVPVELVSPAEIPAGSPTNRNTNNAGTTSTAAPLQQRSPQQAKPEQWNLEPGNRPGYSTAVTFVWLAGSLLVVLLASVLTVGPGRRVYLPGLSVPVPESCAMYSQFGLNCPGCGLTRSFIHFADGNLRAGLSLNPAGIVIFLFVVAQIPAALLRLGTGPRSRIARAWSRANELALIILPCLTLVQWVVRMAILYT